MKRFFKHALPRSIGNCIDWREVSVISDFQHCPMMQTDVLMTGRSSVSPEELLIFRKPTSGASVLLKNFRFPGLPYVTRKLANSFPSTFNDFDVCGVQAKKYAHQCRPWRKFYPRQDQATKSILAIQVARAAFWFSSFSSWSSIRDIPDIVVETRESR